MPPELGSSGNVILHGPSSLVAVSLRVVMNSLSSFMIIDEVNIEERISLRFICVANSAMVMKGIEYIAHGTFF